VSLTNWPWVLKIIAKKKELKRESVIIYVKDLAEFTHVLLIIREMTFQLS